MYRVRLGIIERSPERYYYKELPEHLKSKDSRYKSPEPPEGEVHPVLRSRQNIMVGVLYIVVSIMVTFVLRLLW
jgi:hypothetical protein